MNPKGNKGVPCPEVLELQDLDSGMPSCLRVDLKAASPSRPYASELRKQRADIAQPVVRIFAVLPVRKTPDPRTHSPRRHAGFRLNAKYYSTGWRESQPLRSPERRDRTRICLSRRSVRSPEIPPKTCCGSSRYHAKSPNIAPQARALLRVSLGRDVMKQTFAHASAVGMMVDVY